MSSATPTPRWQGAKDRGARDLTGARKLFTHPPHQALLSVLISCGCDFRLGDAWLHHCFDSDAAPTQPALEATSLFAQEQRRSDDQRLAGITTTPHSYCHDDCLLQAYEKCDVECTQPTIEGPFELLHALHLLFPPGCRSTFSRPSSSPLSGASETLPFGAQSM